MVRAGVALLLVVLVVVSSVSAQLNFSPGWGKRAAAAGGTDAAAAALRSPAALAVGPSSPAAGDTCGAIPVSTVMHIYRLIRSEAARLAQCQDEEYLG
ncbi:red pigment-concentrating hormone-like [Panulirus ornatus]|uniref:red pigment-concentrating hormone-like n=1 Tax=Panulirus ornatus TaxID=150431 RepID=UPI003A864396